MKFERIVIETIEGYTDIIEKEEREKEFATFEDANAYLAEHAKIHDAPEKSSGCYLKTGVTVYFDSGSYKFRYDMISTGAEAIDADLTKPDLKRNVRERLERYAKLRFPSHMTEKAWGDFVDGIYSPEQQKELAEMAAALTD